MDTNASQNHDRAVHAELQRRMAAYEAFRCALADHHLRLPFLRRPFIGSFLVAHDYLAVFDGLKQGCPELQEHTHAAYVGALREAHGLVQAGLLPASAIPEGVAVPEDTTLPGELPKGLGWLCTGCGALTMEPPGNPKTAKEAVELTAAALACDGPPALCDDCVEDLSAQLGPCELPS